MNELLMAAARRLPQPLKAAGKRWFFRGRHTGHPAMRGQGVVQDLYYWMCEPGRIDTVMLVHNFFSVFFPEHETATQGRVMVYDRDGRLLGECPVAVPSRGLQKLRMSQVLEAIGTPAAGRPAEGSVLFQLDVPAGLRERLAELSPSFFFWHRFYIAYVTPSGQPAYVHCVDKTFVFRDDGTPPDRWYTRRGRFAWAPEMPLNIREYARLSVIMINRSPEPAPVSVDVTDVDDRTRRWTQTIPPLGARRFPITPADVEGLHPVELRLTVRGMPTRWGRPVVLKEFANGSLSVMHC